jgi:hypothetical protein
LCCRRGGAHGFLRTLVPFPAGGFKRKYFKNLLTGLLMAALFLTAEKS